MVAPSHTSHLGQGLDFCLRCFSFLLYLTQELPPATAPNPSAPQRTDVGWLHALLLKQLRQGASPAHTEAGQAAAREQCELGRVGGGGIACLTGR